MRRSFLRVLAIAALIPAVPTMASASEFKETLAMGGITFAVVATQSGGKTVLTITPSGLNATNEPAAHEIDGTVVRAEVADIDGNTDPEIYVYTVSKDAEKRGGVIAYAVNKKKSMTPIYIPPIAEDAKNSIGYGGGDESAVVETTFVTRFKIHEGSGAAARPTEKWRQLQYKLKPGEAGWKMVLDQVVEF
jgi:hypothetical protein